MFKKKVEQYRSEGRILSYIDESGFALDMPRTHGYARVGDRCYGTHKWNLRRRENVIGALINNSLTACGIVNGNVDSDTFIDYTPTAYTDITSSFSPPPTPEFILRPLPVQEPDGSVTLDLIIDTYTSKSGYPPAVSTDYFVSQPSVTQLVTNVQSEAGTHPPTFKLGNTTGLTTESLSSAVLTGKVLFSTTTV